MSKYNNNNNESKSQYDFSFLITLLEEHKLKKEFRHLPKYEYFLSLILKEQKTPGDFIPISNRLLKKVIRQEIITRMKDNLLKWEIIKCNYIKRFELVKGIPIGTEPYSYSLTKQYCELIHSNTSADFNGYGFTVEPISTNPITGLQTSALMYNGYGLMNKKLEPLRAKFQEKVNRAIKSRWNDLVNLLQKPQYKYIRDNALRLEIDLSAYQFINEQLNNKVKLKWVKSEFVNDKGKLVVYLNKNRVFNEEIAKQWRNHVEKIERGSYQFSCPASVNRVYYNITSMPSQLRKFLRHNGEQLYYLDYANFQPFLFIKILSDKYGAEMPADVLEYIELTSEGRFYSEIMKLIESEKHEIKDKENFKSDFFGKVFFSSEKINYKYRKIFAQHFPNVSACISESKKANYKDLAIKLQNIESDIVINNVLGEIAQKYPDSFVLPIHDALICSKDMFSIVQQLMLEKAEQIIGYTPTIKYELLTPKIN